MYSEYLLEQQLFDLAIQFESLGRRASRAALGEGVVEAEFRLMFALMQGGQTQAQLSRTVGMDTGQVARTVERLRRKHLIVELASEKGRARTLRLSTVGWHLATEARVRQLSVIRDFLESPSDPQVARLAAVCKHISEKQWEGSRKTFVREALSGEGGIVHNLAVKTLEFAMFDLDGTQVERYAAHAFSDYLRARDTGFGLFLVAERGGVIAGGLVITDGSVASSAHASLLVVERSLIGRGIGSALVGRAIILLREAGYDTLTIDAPRDVEGGSFFEAQGWNCTGQPHRDQWDGSITVEGWSLSLKI